MDLTFDSVTGDNFLGDNLHGDLCFDSSFVPSFCSDNSFPPYELPLGSIGTNHDWGVECTSSSQNPTEANLLCHELIFFDDRNPAAKTVSPMPTSLFKASIDFSAPLSNSFGRLMPNFASQSPRSTSPSSNIMQLLAVDPGACSQHANFQSLAVFNAASPASPNRSEFELASMAVPARAYAEPTSSMVTQIFGLDSGLSIFFLANHLNLL